MDTGPESPKLNRWAIALIWIVLLAGTTFIFEGVLKDINNPNQQLSISLNANGEKEIVLKRNRYGHYVVAGKVNGYDVTFLLDTGATLVSIPEHIANELNLRKGAVFQTETANGLSQSYVTRLDSVAIGDIVMTNVPGSISTGMEFDEILLGMSFLKHLNMNQQGKILILSLPEV